MELSYLLGDLVVGSLSGYATGYFSRKFFRLVCIIVGGYLASLVYLGSRGYLTVNWDRIVASADGILSKIGGLSLGVSVMGIGGVSGFVWGWKSG